MILVFPLANERNERILIDTDDVQSVRETELDDEKDTKVVVVSFRGTGHCYTLNDPQRKILDTIQIAINYGSSASENGEYVH